MVSGALCVAIAAQLTVTARNLLAARSGPSAALAPIVARGGAARIDVGRIAAGHLFGLPPSPAADSPALATESSVALLLTGTVAFAAPSQGSAIIGRKGGPTHLIVAGREIAPGVTLEGVYADHVVLRRGGVLESLAYPRAMSSQLYASQLHSVAAQPTDAREDEESDHSGEAPAPTPEQVAAKLATATTGLTGVLTAKGAFEGSAYKGIRLEPGDDPEAFARAGFHPGDMILGINGITLNDPSMLAMLKSGGTLRVGVRRASGAEVISVDSSALRGY